MTDSPEVAALRKRIRGEALTDEEQATLARVEDEGMTKVLADRHNMRAVVEAARELLADCRDQDRDDCMDDLVDEMFVERLRKALRALDDVSK